MVKLHRPFPESYETHSHTNVDDSSNFQDGNVAAILEHCNVASVSDGCTNSSGRNFGTLMCWWMEWAEVLNVVIWNFVLLYPPPPPRHGKW